MCLLFVTLSDKRFISIYWNTDLECHMHEYDFRFKSIAFKNQSFIGEWMDTTQIKSNLNICNKKKE